MMGFAGQLSLGHALYVGLGAYVAAALFTRFGIAPWLGLLAAMPVARALRRGHWLSRFPFRRFGRLFRDPHHRLCRICPHWLRPSRPGQCVRWPVPAGRAVRAQRSMAAARQSDHVLLRDARGHGVGLRTMPACCCAAVSVISGSPSGRTSRRRAPPVSIRSATRCIAVMISAAVTSFAGVFYAFFYNNLFPEQVFNISRSIEMILGPIIGGIGTLFGPILGAFVLTGLAESLNAGHGGVRRRSAGRQAGILRHLPFGPRGGAARAAFGRGWRDSSASRSVGR